MGFFFKSGGGGDGVTVVEGASFDALATLAKSNDHGALMLDTSTGFYYKNWKTGGPGIPVPVRYYDDVTAYASNSGANRPNCFFTLDDAYSDFIGTTDAENFTTGTPGGSFTLTKTAGNPLILSGTSGSTDSGLIYFQPSSAFDKCLMILKINSATGTSNHRGYGSFIFPQAKNGSTVYSHRIGISTPTAPSIKVMPTSGTGTTPRSIGPDLSISAPEWFWFLSDATASDSLFVNSELNSTGFNVVQRDPAETSVSDPRALLLYLASSTAVGAQELQVSEMHTLIF